MSAGPDSISNRLLKDLAVPLSLLLCTLFNYDVYTLFIRDEFLVLGKKPISRPYTRKMIRPKSLTIALFRYKHDFNFFHDNNILTSLQSEFLPGDSTVNQLADLYNSFFKPLDNGKEVRAVFCDIHKAFDRVWHRGLLYKLRRAGITSFLLSWFYHHLQDRKQRVVLQGSASDWFSIQAGVLQYSILSPLLILRYINDNVEDINS